ncbi:MAG: gamma-glutamylcyclotransferase [Zetaproteobacteria bacterium]|nr:gamma-glutamylcyclotransferase [Zetaproteobacteria bacterium]
MLIFVYGTLKRGHDNHRWLTGATFIDEGFAHGTMYDIDGAYPGVIFGGSDTVQGEVYDVDAVILQSLDGLEGFDPMNLAGALYVRREVAVTSEVHPQGISCIAYQWNCGIEYAAIESGIW